jgi:hypothetical protein
MRKDDDAILLQGFVRASHFRAYNLKATIDGIEYTWASAGAIVMTSREWWVRKGTLREIGNMVFVAEHGSMFTDPRGFWQSAWDRIKGGPTPFVPWYVHRTVAGQPLFDATHEDIKHAIFMA